MTTRKTIAVIGARGAQGGGLARAILTDPGGGFAVRALTRKPDSAKAVALQALGAEVVFADADQPASLEPAFQGAYGIFMVTNFWEHFSAGREYAQAGAMAGAAKAAGAGHVIWSTLEDTRRWVPLSDNRMPTLQAKYKVPHFDAKGEADNLFRDLGVPATFLRTSFYWDNFIHFGMGPRPGPKGKLALTLCMGDRPLPAIAAEDIGKCAYGIFRQGVPWIGKTPGLAGEHLTGTQLAAALTRALGREVVYNSITPEAYRALGFPGADDLGNMFQFKRDLNAEYCAARDPRVARALNPDLMTFDAWLTRYKKQIPLE